ncbi:MAG: T9SS type A sorting domain-containing protein [Bacteroidales bacterium]|nr:T9SS type A sorting domain-containing protein [Bacteroidales bacterium]
MKYLISTILLMLLFVVQTTAQSLTVDANGVCLDPTSGDKASVFTYVDPFNFIPSDVQWVVEDANGNIISPGTGSFDYSTGTGSPATIPDWQWKVPIGYGPQQVTLTINWKKAGEYKVICAKTNNNYPPVPLYPYTLYDQTVTVNKSEIDVATPVLAYEGQNFMELAYNMTVDGGTPDQYEITWPNGDFVDQGLKMVPTSGPIVDVFVTSDLPLIGGTSHQGELRITTTDGCVSPPMAFTFNVSTPSAPQAFPYVGVTDPDGVIKQYTFTDENPPAPASFDRWSVTMLTIINNVNYGNLVDGEFEILSNGGGNVASFPGITGDVMTWTNATGDDFDFNVKWEGLPGLAEKTYTLRGYRHDAQPSWRTFTQDVVVVTPPHFYENVEVTHEVLDGDAITFDILPHVGNQITPTGYVIEPKIATETVSGLPAARTVETGTIVDYTVAQCITDPVEYLIYPYYTYIGDDIVSIRPLTLIIKNKLQISVVPSLPLPIEACEGSVLTFVVTRLDTPNGPWHIVYDDGLNVATTDPIIGDDISLSTVVTVDGQTFEIIKIVDEGTGCELADASFSYPIAMKIMPVIEINNIPGIVCENTPFSIGVSRTDANVDYSDWTFAYTDGVNSGVIDADLQDATISLPGLPAGNYTLTITDILDNVTTCPNPGPYTAQFTVRKAPEVAITVTSDTTDGVCKNSLVNFRVERIDSEFRPGDSWKISYEFEGTTYTEQSLTSSLTFSVTPTASSASTLTNIVVLNNETACEYFVDDIEINVLDIPAVTFRVKQNPICNSGTNTNVEFVITRTDGGIKTNWSVIINDGTTDHTFNVTTAVAEFDLAITETTTYTLVKIINNVTGCEDATPGELPITVVLSDLPQVTFTTDSDLAVCQAEEVEFIVTRTDGAATDDWTVYYSQNTQKGSQNFTGITGTFALTFNQLGTSTVKIDSIVNVTQAGDGSIATSTTCWNKTNLPAALTFTVTVNPGVEIKLVKNAVCDGNAATFTIERKDAGAKTDWSFIYEIDGVVQPTVTSTTALYTLDLTLPEGVVTVAFTKVINNLTGCEAALTNSFNVTVNSLPTATFTSDPAHNTEICEGEDIEFTVTRTDANIGPKWSLVILSKNLNEPYEEKRDTITATAASFMFPLEAPALPLGTDKLVRRYYLESIIDSTSLCTVNYGEAFMIQLTILPKPQATFAVNVEELCAGGAFTFTTTRIDAGISTDWSYVIDFEFKNNTGLNTTYASPSLVGVRTDSYTFPIISTITADSLTATITAIYNGATGCDADILPAPIKVNILELPKLASITLDGNPAGAYDMCEDQLFKLKFERIDGSYTEGDDYVINLVYTDFANQPIGTEALACNTKVVEHTMSINKDTKISVESVVNMETGCINSAIADEFILTMIKKPQVTVTYQPPLFCGGSQQVVFNITYDGTLPTNGWEYTWSAIPEHTTTTVSVTTITDFFTFYVNEYTTVKIYDITNMDTNCVNTDTLEYIIAKPNVVVLPLDNRIFCESQLTQEVVFEGLPIAGYDEDDITYLWTVTDGATLAPNFPTSGQNSIPSFEPELDNSVSDYATVTIDVTPVLDYNGPDECYGNTVEMTFYVVANPEVSNIEDYSLCANESTTQTQFEGHFTRLTWENMGDTFEEVPVGPQYFETLPVTFPAYALENATEDVKQLVIKINTENKVAIEGVEYTQCTKEQIWTITVNPEVTIDVDIAEAVSLCDQDVIEAIQLEGVAEEFRYRIAGDDAGFDPTLYPMNTWIVAPDGLVPELTVTNTGMAPITFTIEYIGVFGKNSLTGLECVSDIKLTEFIVNPKPYVSDLLDYATCDQITVGFEFSGVATTYEWENAGEEIEGLPQSGEGLTFGPYTMTNTTNWPNPGELSGKKAIVKITPVYDANGKRCEGEVEEFEIVLNPTSRMIIQSLVYCHEEEVPAYYFESTTDNDHTSYVWEHLYGPDLGIIQFGVDSIPAFTALNEGFAPIIAYYRVTPTYSKYGKVCEGESKDFMIIVNPRPIIAPVADQVYCGGDEVAEYIFTGSVEGATYEWTKISGDIIPNLPTSGYNVIPAFTAVNTTGATITATYSVTATYQTANPSAQICTSEVAVVFTISIVPNGTLAQIPNQTVCMNTDVEIELDGTATRYIWTVVEGEDVGVGAMAGVINVAVGATPKLAFTAKNNLTAPIYAIFEMTPVFEDTTLGHTCTGVPVRFRVDVYPSIEAPYVANQEFCAGTATPVISFNGPIPGTVYRWEVLGDGVTIPGLPKVGYGDIPSFTPVNNTTEPIVYTLEVGANNVGDCAGKREFTITVMPKPTVTAIANQEFCASNGAVSIPITGVATAYNWTIIGGVALDPGAGVSGTLTTINTGAATLSINVPISHTVIRTATYQLEPVYGTCTGEAITFTVTVYPEIHVDPIENRIYCHNTQVPEIQFSGNIDEITYYWNITSGNQIPGLPAAGIGTIPSFYVQNIGNEVVTYMFDVQPSISLANGGTCAGTKQSFSISVIPEPTVDAIPSMEYCAGDNVAAYAFTGTATKFAWTKTEGENVGLPVQSGENQIPAFVAKNDGSTSLTATFTVTPYYMHTLVGQNIFRECQGEPVTFTITVHPKVDILPVADKEFCANETVPTIILPTSVAGAVVKWEVTGDNIGLPETTGYGDIPSFETINTGNTVAQATIKLTVDGNCGNNTQEFNIKVYPEVKVDPSTVADIEVCTTGGETVIVNPTANVSPVTFKWINDRSDIGWPWETIANTMYFEPVNNTDEAIVATITLIPLYIKHVGQEEYCEGEAHTFTITVQPKVSLNSATDLGEICGSRLFEYEATTTHADAKLSWRREGVVGINGGQGASGDSGLISEVLRNATSEAITVIYTFTIDYRGCQTTDEVTVTVLPAPIVVVEAMATACPTDNEVRVSTDVSGMSYKVYLDQAARSAGFKEVTHFKPMEGNDFIIETDNNLKPGVYNGTVVFQGSNSCDAEYPFSFRVYKPLLVAYVTEDVFDVCDVVSVDLEIVIDSDNDVALNYQWFYENERVGSNSATYTAERTGTYRVEVTRDACPGEKLTEYITVKFNDIEIKHKWDDVLYVDDRGYQSYQWYKDGFAINNGGNAQYCPIDDGGYYSIRVYYADGTSRMSCEQKVEKSIVKNTIVAYPNPVNNHDVLNVYIDIDKSELEGAQISIYDITGRMYTHQVVDNSRMTIKMDAVPGVYVVYVISASGEVYTKKVVVR